MILIPSFRVLEKMIRVRLNLGATRARSGVNKLLIRSQFIIRCPRCLRPTMIYGAFNFYGSAKWPADFHERTEKTHLG